MTFVYPNIHVSQYVNSEGHGYTYKLKREKTNTIIFPKSAPVECMLRRKTPIV